MAKVTNINKSTNKEEETMNEENKNIQEINENVEEKEEVVEVKRGKDLWKFVKDHKKEIIMGTISIVLIAGGAYIIYKTGFKAGFKDGEMSNMPIDGADCNIIGKMDGDSYSITIDGPTFGGGELVTGCVLTQENAIGFAKGILKDLGCLKEVLEVGKDIAEVIDNG